VFSQGGLATCATIGVIWLVRTKLKRINLDGALASGLELQAAIPGLQIVR
jgi:hypothetical protein